MELETRNSLFFLLPEIGPCPETAAAALLALGLPRDRFRVEVGVLGPAEGGGAESLKAAGIGLRPLPLRNAFDLGGVRRLRQAVREAGPDVVHAFGPEAARVARLVVSGGGDRGNTPRLVASGAATPGDGLWGWLASRQLRRADRVVAVTRAEGERYRRLGVSPERLSRVTPAAPDPAPLRESEALLRRLGVPPGARLVVVGGRGERGFGPKDAIVAFDMLRYDTRDLHLAMFGLGANSATLERFGQSLAFDDLRVRLPRDAADRPAAVGLASVVWVTAPRGGHEEALEAMAAGKPVVAWASADLQEIVEDGATGFLVPVGDRAALAAKTRVLLGDPVAAARMGEAGRSRALGRFPAAKTLEQFARVYGEVTAE